MPCPAQNGVDASVRRARHRSTPNFEMYTICVPKHTFARQTPSPLYSHGASRAPARLPLASSALTAKSSSSWELHGLVVGSQPVTRSSFMLLSVAMSSSVSSNAAALITAAFSAMRWDDVVFGMVIQPLQPLGKHVMKKKKKKHTTYA